MPKTIGQAKEQRIRRLHDSGKPHAEIAHTVGVNPATVKRLVEGGYHSPSHCKPQRCPQCGTLVTLMIDSHCMSCHISALPRSPSMWLGIDPGNASGALAIIDDDKPVDVFNMPKSDGEVGQLIRTLASNYKFAGVTVEKVWAGGKNTGTGKATMGVSSAFKFGANFGAICAALSCVGMKYELVAPVSWKPKMGLPKGATKKDSLGAARELFPKAELTQRNSEAWLLAEYGRRYCDTI